MPSYTYMIAGTQLSNLTDLIAYPASHKTPATKFCKILSRELIFWPSASIFAVFLSREVFTEGRG